MGLTHCSLIRVRQYHNSVNVRFSSASTCISQLPRLDHLQGKKLSFLTCPDYSSIRQPDGWYARLTTSQGAYPLPTLNHVVPVSDGAGTVEAIGPGVNRFQPGDGVLTLFEQGRIAGSPANKTETKSVGGTTNGALRQYGAYDEEDLVAMPATLDFQQASTLSCAAVRAWNALYGLAGNMVKAGDTVLTQGTGGVSMFALQVRFILLLFASASMIILRWSIGF